LSINSPQARIAGSNSDRNPEADLGKNHVPMHFYTIGISCLTLFSKASGLTLSAEVLLNTEQAKKQHQTNKQPNK